MFDTLAEAQRRRDRQGMAARGVVVITQPPGEYWRLSEQQRNRTFKAGPTPWAQMVRASSLNTVAQSGATYTPVRASRRSAAKPKATHAVGFWPRAGKRTDEGSFW